MFPELASIIFATRCFFTENSKTETLNKATGKIPLTSPHQLLVGEFFNCSNYLLSLSGLPDFINKVFVISFKFS